MTEEVQDSVTVSQIIYSDGITAIRVRLHTISGFAFVDIAALRRPKSMSKPNFVDIFQLMAEI